MASVNPQTFFRFAADHHELLSELYRHRDGISEARLTQVIRRYETQAGPSPEYMVDRLHELGFIDHAPHATAQYEMTRPFAELMAALLRDYRLTSVEVIRSYFTAMNGFAEEVRQAIYDKNGEMLVRTLNEAAEHVERMRDDSRRNREGVIATAMGLKSNPGFIPPRQRYEIINRLWMRYLVPLRDMIDVEKAMDASLDCMENAMEDADSCFHPDPAISPQIGMGHARLRRLRRDIVRDFRESMREITPLYEELRRENALARGAAHALEEITSDGLLKQGFAEDLGICNWQQQGLFSDNALKAYMLTLQGYEPTRPEPLRDVVTDTAGEYVRIDRFDTLVSEALPIADAISWLAKLYPEAPLHTVLRLYGRLHSGYYGTTSFATAKKDYPTGDAVLTAHPMRIDEDEDKK